MCSSSGHNQVRRGSDHRHRLAQAGQKFLSNPLSSLCQAMILCCFFCELELSNILLYFDTSLVLTIKTRENAEANIIIKNKEVSLVLSLFPILCLLCVKQCFFAVFFSHTRTFQHSFYVISKHFSGPHNNNNKGECRLQNQK